MALVFKVLFDRRDPFGRMRFETFCGQLRLQFNGRLLKPDFNHRKIGSRRLQKFVEGESADLELRGVKVVEAAAKMNHDEVALVSELRKNCAVAAFAPFHRGKCARGFFDDFRATTLYEGVPLWAAQAKELMQDGEAFERVGRRRQIARSG